MRGDPWAAAGGATPSGRVAVPLDRESPNGCFSPGIRSPASGVAPGCAMVVLRRAATRPPACRMRATAHSSTLWLPGWLTPGPAPRAPPCCVLLRGELYNKALELQKQGRELIFTNGGAPGRAAGQAPC